MNNRVVLIQPPVQDFYLTRKRTIPYGLASIAASLESSGFDCTIIDALATKKSRSIDLPREFKYLSEYYGRGDDTLFSLFHSFRHFGYAYEHLGNRVREKKPFLVGISSLFTPYADQALETAKMVKKFYPTAWVVLGGHHPTAFPRETLAHKAVDFVIQGEGENALPELCCLLEGYQPEKETQSHLPWSQLKKIPGLGLKENDRIISNDPDWINDLDALPLPAMGKISQPYYARNKKTSITIVAGRGCPFKCTYCSVSASSCHGRFRQRSTRHILKEISEQAMVSDIGFIDFEDENLTLNKQWALDLFTGIKEIFKDRSVELRAMNGLYPPSLDKEMILAMKAAGFSTLNLSVGSFSKSQLTRFKRPDVRAAHGNVLKTAMKMGLQTVSYIIGSAPGQNASQTLEDLLILAGQPTLAGLSIFYPAPGSSDYQFCYDQGLLPEQFSLMRSAALPLNHTTTRVQAVTLLRIARIINFLKEWVDTHGRLPRAKTIGPGDEKKVSALFQESDASRQKRVEASKTLVQWFLNDGVIRGIDQHGIYVHKVDAALCKKAVQAIVNQPFMGVTTGPYSAG